MRTANLIPEIPPPIIPYQSVGSDRISRPITEGLRLPVIEVSDPSVDYPVIDVPTQDEFNAAVKAEQKKKESKEVEEKSRQLPDVKLPENLNKIIQQSVPTSQETTKEPVQEKNTQTTISPEMHVPFLGNVPVPTNKEVMLAGTTAVAATAAAIVGKSAVEFLLKFFKPIANQMWIRSKKLLSKDLTDYEIQSFFAFETDAKLKKVSKLLKKEQRIEKIRQYKQSKGKK